MKKHFQSTVVVFFCCCLLAPATDLDAIRANIRDGRDKLRTDKHAEGVALLNTATKNLEKHLKENPGDFKAAYQLGMVSFYLEDDEKALKSYSLAAKLDPTDSRPWFFTGLIHRYAGKFEAAKKAFLKASELAPKDADNWYELGVLYSSADETSEAIAAFETSLKLNPNDAQTSYELALSYTDSSQFEKARPLLEKATKANPNNIEINYNMGQLYQNLGETEQALAAFELVVKLDPLEWHAMEKLVQLNQERGNRKARDEARKMILDLWTSKEVESLNAEPLYIRDQFKVESNRVMTCEYFEMKGVRAIRYSFVITDETGKSGKYRITLGSYDQTNRIAHKVGDVKDGQRLFHLDGYYADGSHRTFDFFRGEPDYDEVKGLVIKILEGEKRSISSTVPTPKKETTD